MILGVFVVSKGLLFLGVVKLGRLVKGGGITLELSFENVDLVDHVRGNIELSASNGSNGDHRDASRG
jgi:hypothetical protein